MMALPFIMAWAMSTGMLPELDAQEASYVHPIYPFGFEAGPHWEEALSGLDGKVLQLTNPNRNVVVVLRFIPGADQPEKAMETLSGLNGLICTGGLCDTLLNGRSALLLRGVCLQGRKPFRRLIAGIPVEHGLYVMEICCPEECYTYHRDQMQALLGSLKVGS